MIQSIARAASERGWKALIVGGFVRDQVAGKPSKDIDLEFFGPTAEELRRFLGQFGDVKAVGASFGVFKLTCDGQNIDCSLPRRESKNGNGHRGFVVSHDDLTPEEAAARRDFTMNSMMQDPLTGEILDPFFGRLDLAAGILRHTSPAFAEDPLRVLRGMQFCSRFHLIPTDTTARLCQSLTAEFHTLPKDRIWEEWKKWAKGESPAMGLEFLEQAGWLSLFPELNALVGLEQEPKHHPEGDAWEHTLQALEMAAHFATRERLSEQDRIILVLATLCHDLGKATTTEVRDGRITSFGHNEAGAAFSFLMSIGAPRSIIGPVLHLVREHMAHVFAHTVTTRTVRRLANRLEDGATIRLWALLVEADHSGRFPLPVGMPAKAREILDLARDLELTDEQPEPILMGRHLIDCLGMQPGRHFGNLLRGAFEAQLDGAFDDLEGALAWMREAIAWADARS